MLNRGHDTNDLGSTVEISEYYKQTLNVVKHKMRKMVKPFTEMFLLNHSDFSMKLQQYPSAHQVVRFEKLPFLISSSPQWLLQRH